LYSIGGIKRCFKEKTEELSTWKPKKKTARSSLKYFAEDGCYGIPAAGSLLGIQGYCRSKMPSRGSPKKVLFDKMSPRLCTQEQKNPSEPEFHGAVANY